MPGCLLRNPSHRPLPHAAAGLACLPALAVLFPALMLLTGTPAAATALQSTSSPSPVENVRGPDPPRVSVRLLGGWASFSQTSVNSSIRIDNMLLTTPADSGGVGLSRGLRPITDGLGGTVEVSLAMGEVWRVTAGVQRIAARTRRDFSFDPGDGIRPAYMEYEVAAWPIALGAEYGYALGTRLHYRMGAALLYFPSSHLGVRGSIGGVADLNEEGTASGAGALFHWGGHAALGERLSLVTRLCLRLGRLGEVRGPDGDPIQTFTGQRLGLDWSGVDLLVGVQVRLF